MNQPNLLVLSIMIFVFSLLSCSKNIEIEGLDTQAWKNDPKACKGIRSSLEKDFIHKKNELLGFNQKEIMQLMGKPDGVELYKRNQKFFIYYLEGGKKCNTDSPIDKPRSLFIRFSALDVSNEVFVKK